MKIGLLILATFVAAITATFEVLNLIDNYRMSFFDNMFTGGDKHEHWLDLKKETQLQDLLNESKQKPVAVTA